MTEEKDLGEALPRRSFEDRGWKIMAFNPYRDLFTRKLMSYGWGVSVKFAYRLSLTLLCILGSLRLSTPCASRTSVSAQAIDSYLRGKNSPMAGEGAHFLKWGHFFNVDPRVVVAIAGAETTFGRRLNPGQSTAPGGKGFNAWNWCRYCCTGPGCEFDQYGFAKFWAGVDPTTKGASTPVGPLQNALSFETGWENGIFWVTRQIWLYRQKGCDTVHKILVNCRYCVGACTNWEGNVETFMREMGGDPNDLTWPGAEELVLFGADITIGSYTAAPGDVVVVEVKVSERVKGVAGAKLVLEFGQIGEVTSEGEVKYGVIPPGGRVSASLSEPGKVVVEVAGSSGGDGPGTLVYIPIKLRSDLKAGSYPLVLRVEHLSDTAGNVLYGPGDGTPGEVKVVRRGDMNGDDRVTTSDATIALRIAIGLERASEYQLRVGDLNGNGKIDVSDATKILRGAIGLERL